MADVEAGVRNISIVVPVYRGRETLPDLITEIVPLTTPQQSECGKWYRVSEVILVWDCGPDGSDQVIRELSATHSWVRPVWLSKNYGQHAATMAGMASAGGDWVATIDEDGQHDPASLGALLDRALTHRAQIVYGAPSNPPPHGAVRNAASRFTKSVVLRALTQDRLPSFHSYRLVLGEIARSVAAYAGPGVYLDVALSWVSTSVSHCPVVARREGRAAATYTYRRLASHFWRLIISSGTRPLRLVSAAGVALATVGLLMSIWFVIQRLTNQVPIEGWTSVIVSVFIIGGATLLSLGVIAEYVGAALRTAMGRPLYVTTRDPQEVFGEHAVDGTA